MKNIQIIDEAANATFSVFQATAEEFSLGRLGEDAAGHLLTPLWSRPVLKRDAMGIHGVLYYDARERRNYLPATKREVDWDESAINPAQRELFRLKRQA